MNAPIKFEVNAVIISSLSGNVQKQEEQFGN